MKLIYVAGPISGNELANIGKAVTVANMLMDWGFAVICPHSMSALMQMTKPRTHQEWLQMDFEIIRRCDALFRIAGPSVGADMEVKFSKDNGIPVFYDMRSLIGWVKPEDYRRITNES